MKNVIERRAETLANINAELAKNGTTSKKYETELSPTKFNGSLYSGSICDETGVIGFTSEKIRKVIECLTASNFAYCKRQTKYNISVYGYDNTMPNGVKCIGGVPNQLEFLIDTFAKTYISPTEKGRC